MNTITILVLLGLLALAVFFDLRARKIPNKLILLGLALGFGLASLQETTGLMDALAGFGIGFAVFLPLYVLRIFGAGDVKLMAVVGSFLGVTGTIGAMLSGLVAGGVLTIGYGLYLGRLREILRNTWFMVCHFGTSLAGGQMPQAAETPATQIKLPYSLAIASGVLILVSVRYWFTGAIN
jgi:prepilin peptidase CpaA